MNSRGPYISRATSSYTLLPCLRHVRTHGRARGAARAARGSRARTAATSPACRRRRGRPPRATGSARARSACGKGGLPPDTGPPPPGGCGRSAIARVISNHVGRMPFRRSAAVMGGIGMPPAAARSMMRRTGACLGEPAGGIAEAVRGAAVIHADEAPVRPGGANVWVWTFLDPAAGSTLFVVRPGRGGGAPGGGGGARGGMGRDRRPRRMGVVQGMPHAGAPGPHNRGDAPRPGEARVREMRRGARGAPPHMRRRMRADAASARMPGARRGNERRRLHGRVRAMMRRHEGHHATGGFMERPGRALPNLFAFVLDPPMAPTSNAAERGLRGWSCTGRYAAAQGPRGPWS